MNLATDQKMRGFYFENIGDKNMKKIIITAAVAVVTAIAAQAQVPNVEVQMADAGFKALALAKSSAQKKNSSKSLEQAVERQVAKKVADSSKEKPACATKVQAPKTASAPAVGTTKKSSIRRAWLKAIFLGGPFPGETPEAYHSRLMAQSHPASLPYK